MYHLHLVLRKHKDAQYELSLKQRKMYEQIEGDNIDDIIIYSDSCFSKLDRDFIRNDIKNELKKEYRIFYEKMRYHNIGVNQGDETCLINNIPSIVMEKRIIIKTDDLEGLTNKLYSLADFYQMLFKYEPLSPIEPEINEEEIEGIEEGDEYDGDFQYY
jgi:hypothetical protein